MESGGYEAVTLPAISVAITAGMRIGVEESVEHDPLQVRPRELLGHRPSEFRLYVVAVSPCLR